MNTPTVVPLMVWVAFLVWGYLAMAVCHISIIVCRLVPRRFMVVLVQIVVGVAIVVATVWYNNVFNSGSIRLYVLLGGTLGALLYYFVCFDVVDNLAHRVWRSAR